MKILLYYGTRDYDKSPFKEYKDCILKDINFTDFDTCVDCINGKQTNKSSKGA